MARARAARDALGGRAFVLGHHYQRDEVIAFADFTGDSFKLAQLAAAHPEAESVVFCGVHFMAETADILTGPTQQVVLPDLAAGLLDGRHGRDRRRSRTLGRADRRRGRDVSPDHLHELDGGDQGFLRRHGGVVCTSSNAARVLEWAFEQGEKVLFLPDQHLGRNTAFGLGMPLDDMRAVRPPQPGGGLDAASHAAARMILWRGSLLGAREVHRGRVDGARAAARR